MTSLSLFGMKYICTIFFSPCSRAFYFFYQLYPYLRRHNFSTQLTSVSKPSILDKPYSYIIRHFNSYSAIHLLKNESRLEDDQKYVHFNNNAQYKKTPCIWLMSGQDFLFKIFDTRLRWKWDKKISFVNTISKRIIVALESETYSLFDVEPSQVIFRQETRKRNDIQTENFLLFL